MATNAVGHSLYSADVLCTTPPPAPTNLTVAAAAGNRVQLSWTDPSTRETGYAVERATSPTGPWVGLMTLGPNSTFCSLAGSYDGSTTYYFRVSTMASGVRSAAAVTSVTTPAWPSAPRSFTVMTRSATSNDLSWSPASGASGYSVQRDPGGTNDWTTIATLGADATSYSDTSAPQGTTSSYRVKANNDDGSVPSASAEAHSNASWRSESGFTETELDPNDDLYSKQQVDLGFSIVFGGHEYSKLWVNNNGNVTFDSDLGTFTPFDLESTTTRIIAAFFADVDTRTGYSLQWLPSLDDMDKLPKSGTRTVIAAKVNGLLCEVDPIV